MDRWLCLLLLESIISLIPTSGSVAEARCIQLRFFDADSLPFRGLLLQKHEQTDVWIQASPSDDDGSTLTSNRLSSELSSLGTLPVVMVTTSTATYQIPVEWESEVYKWKFSLLTYTYRDFGFTVQVQLSPQQANTQCADVSVLSFTVLIASKAPGVQWLLDHGTAYGRDFNSEETFNLTRLHCYPEVMLAVQGHNLFFSENGFKTTPSYSYDICSMAQLSSMDCSSLVIEDILLTRSNLLVLTQNGLFVSATTTGNAVALEPIENLPFETQGAHFEMNSLICNHINMADYDKVLITGRSREEPAVFHLWKSAPPYTLWERWSTTLCSMPSVTCDSMRVVYNPQRRTYIAAMETTPATVYVIEEGGGFKFFQLPSGFAPTGIVHHSSTSTVYLVGNEIWMSVDGGLTFSRIYSFSNGESIIDCDHNEQRIMFLTSTGRLYHTRPRSLQILELDLILHNTTELVFDSTGELNAISLDAENGTIASVMIPLSTSEKENIRICQFSVEIVNSYLLLVYTNGSNNTCLLSKGDIGLTANASFGNGVILTVEKNHALVGMVDYPELATDNPDTQSSEWMVYDEVCWFKLVGASRFNEVHEMDIGDHLLLQIKLELVTGVSIPRNLIPDALWEVSVIFGNPQLFDFFITHHHHPSNHYMAVDIWQKDTSMNPVQTTVTFQLVHCSTHCKRCALTAVISSICPVGKRLRFVYPTEQATSALYKLPTNYRPPSWLGTDIPLSPNIYNSDPSQPLMNSKYDISKRAARFNQCAGNSSRAECNCSSVMAASTDIGFSDCIQRVYQHVSGNSFLLNFQLELSASGSVEPVHHILHLQELNNRTDYTVEGQPDTTIINTSSSKKLVCNGPGLYHFRATITDRVSFCSLQAQFTVFVVRTPLTRAGEYSTTVLTTVLIGLGILASYVLHNHFSRLQKH